VFMPISCITYKNTFYIKYDFYEDRGWQCHANNLGSHFVSIEHYMHAYFNQKAIELGSSFVLPWDAGYLNCVKLPEPVYTSSDRPLYAKIGCEDHKSASSKRFSLHIYSDNNCTISYDEGFSKRRNGKYINGYWMSTSISFNPGFYECKGCNPAQVAESFKQENFWRDDDYLNYQELHKQFNDDVRKYSNATNTYSNSKFWWESYGTRKKPTPSPTMSPLNQIPSNAPTRKPTKAPSSHTGKTYWWQYRGSNDDTIGYGNRRLREPYIFPIELELYHEIFWENIRRELSEGSGVQKLPTWNFCERIYNHSLSCDKSCQRIIDNFVNKNRWSAADVGILGMLFTFITAMIYIILVKRAKSYQRAVIYEDESDTPYPGLPPIALAMIFLVVIGVILGCVYLNLVNQALVISMFFGVILLIMLMKVTLCGETHYREPQRHYASMRKRVLL